MFISKTYRPAGKAWPCITSYNVVISILAVFILLTKAVLFVLHVFPPILSVFTHALLVALYAVSASYQGGSDTSDPDRLQKGAPWYITKSCSVAYYKSNIHYCNQAKAAFILTIVTIVIFFGQTVYSIICCIPTHEEKVLRSEKASRAKSAYAEAAALSPAPNTAHKSPFPSASVTALRSPTTPGSQYQKTWGTEAVDSKPYNKNTARLPTSFPSPLQPMTPRTQAFNRLGGTTSATPPPKSTTTTVMDLPLRQHFSSPNAPRSPTFGVKSPLASSFDEASNVERGEQRPMYFPPPPKVSNGGKGKK
ncbi:hypothetical protein UCRPC4_g01517 [Phaeomoniella chlamydospora]|uniref:Uncharacterized protein n=1 Tax=Phaeomoniella chlamydospora TaxID=158046 RepID=A0A0G2GT74_PHACM|nr:hypothetical protein UCRPC4_g01517 [Phaeomoniella chlamydospora]